MAKQPKVKCPICQEYFQREDTPFVHYKNRYYHKSCYDEAENQKTEEEKERELLIEYIKHLFDIGTLTAKINRQIKDYIEKGYSYKGIRLTLQYWFEIKGNSVEKANNGIGIVGYVYDQASKYWKSIWEAQKQNQQAVEAEIVVPVREIRITSPERKPMKILKKLFNFLEEGDEAR